MAIIDERAGQAPEPDHELGKMTLFEHLAELRKRLIISILAVVAGGIVGWFLYNDLVHFMTRPYHHYLVHNPNQDITKGKLVLYGPLEGFATRLKVSAYAGIAIASPVIIWQLWKFITPGLYRKEKRYILPFASAALGLFAGGVATAILVIPKALDWLIRTAGPGFVTQFSASRYFTFYMTMCLIFGAVFMYPLVVVFLEIIGVVPSATWRKWRRPAIVIMMLIAAVITPSSDPFSFVAMALPMLVFYEGSIIVGRLLHK